MYFSRQPVTVNDLFSQSATALTSVFLGNFSFFLQLIPELCMDAALNCERSLLTQQGRFKGGLGVRAPIKKSVPLPPIEVRHADILREDMLFIA